MSLILPYDEEPAIIPLKIDLFTELYYAERESILTESECSSARLSVESATPRSVKYLFVFAAKIEEDEIWKPALFKDEDDPEEFYKRECLQYSVTPIKAFIDVLNGNSSVLDLQCFRASDMNTYLICKALLKMPDAPIRVLNLSYNNFSKETCSALSKFLQNSSLEELNLSHCYIGEEGIEILCEGIEISPLTHLNLARCNLRDRGGVAIAKILAYNDVLKFLDLSYNNLQLEAAIELGKMFETNMTLEVVNLKWNSFYTETSIAKLAKGLRKNKALKSLNLSWNGLCDEHAKPIALTLKYHSALEVLNLEYNLFTKEHLITILAGVSQSKTLQECYLGGNRWTPEAIKYFLTGHINTYLRVFSFGHLLLEHDDYNSAINIMKNGSISILFDSKIKPNPPEPVDFQEIVLARAKYSAQKPKKRKLKRDFGHFMLKLLENKEEMIKIPEFEELLKRFKAKLDANLVNHLIQEYTIPIKIGKLTGKRIKIKEMAEKYLAKFPTDPPPPVAVVPKKRGKKNQNKVKNAKNPR